MLSTDREEFTRAMQRLAAGFGVPATPEREGAYWEAFARLSMAQFSRLVDHVLSEDYAAELEGKRPSVPTVPQLWRVHRQLRARISSAGAPASAPAASDPDHLEYFANRLLLAHLSARGGLGSTGTFLPGYGITDAKASPELKGCLAAKRALVAEFCGCVREGDELATPREFLRRFVVEIKKLGEVRESTLQQYRAIAVSPSARAPFAPHMARPLPIAHVSA
jgi:hypothetical protein